MNKIITTKCINGKLRVGDTVISTPDDEYDCLIGKVKEIYLVGTPDHDTENETDDVYVDFTVYDYSDKRIKEIEEAFSEVYNTSKYMDEISLDEVIMPPDNLIRITDVDEACLKDLLDSGYSAASYCYCVLSGLTAQTGAENIPAESERSEIKDHLFSVLDSALAMAGYKILDGDKNSIILRHSPSDTDYEIKVAELPR